LVHRSSPIKVCCDALKDFVVEPFRFSIAYVEPDIAGKSVGENNTQLFSWHWPGVDESIVPILTSIVDTTIFSIVNGAVAGLPDPTRKIRELWDCLEEPNGNGGPYARNVTPIFDNNTAAGWVKEAIKLSNPKRCCVVECGQQADGTDGARTPMRGGSSYRPLDAILPPQAERMIDDIGEESDDDGEMWCPNPRSFPTTKTGFQKFERKLQKRITRQQRYLEVIRTRALGLCADYEQSVVADEDVAWLPELNHIVNPPAAGSLANWKRKRSRPAANLSL